MQTKANCERGQKPLEREVGGSKCAELDGAAVEFIRFVFHSLNVQRGHRTPRFTGAERSTCMNRSISAERRPMQSLVPWPRAHAIHLHYAARYGAEELKLVGTGNIGYDSSMLSRRSATERTPMRILHVERRAHALDNRV